MSAEIINLRHARKQKQRKGKEKQADNNRRKFGRTKAEREEARKRRETLETQVDGHQLDSAGTPSDSGTD